MGKSYDLEDSILYRIQNTGDGDSKTEKRFETWLMSNIFRHVENPNKEINPEQKYIGKVKFTKIYKKAKFDSEENEKWTPPKTNQYGDDIEDRKPVVDIEIVVYKDNDMKIPRRYELEHGWKDEWIKQGICDFQREPISAYKAYEDFKKKWVKMQKKMKVPNWYLFDPEHPTVITNDHNMMKKWDEKMFNFLKDQKWTEKISERDAGGFRYEEKAEFVVDCSQLLGIGGEGILIRKSITERVTNRLFYEKPSDRKYDALKIIPLNLRYLEDKDNVQHTREIPGNTKRNQGIEKRQVIIILDCRLFFPWISRLINFVKDTVGIFRAEFSYSGFWSRHPYNDVNSYHT